MLGAGAGALFTKAEIPPVWHFFSMSALAMILQIWAAQNLVADPSGPSEAEADAGFQLPAKALLGIGLITFCSMLGEVAMADWSTIYMREVALSDAALAPVALGAFSTAMMIGRILGDGGRIRFGDDKLLVFNSLLSLAGVALFIIWPQPWTVITGLFLVGLGLSVIVPIAYSTAGAMPGIAPGVGISMVTTIGYSGFLFGPPIIGFVADWQGLQTAMLFVVGLFLLMTVLSVRRGLQRPQEAV